MKNAAGKTSTEPKLTARHRRKLEVLSQRSDGTIDYSDIPPLGEKFWKSAVRNPFYRPVKKQVTLRIDADILEWLRRQGKGYQSRLNSVLRSAMIEQLRGKEKRA